MNRSYAVWLLVYSLLFLSLAGLFGGYSLLSDASGSALGMEEVLPLLPVSDYTIPGGFIFVFYGAGSLFLVYGLLVRPDWNRLTPISRLSRHYWAWTGTLILSIVLVVWLVVQGVLIGFHWPIQYVSAVCGFFILLFTLLPKVRSYYAL